MFVYKSCVITLSLLFIIYAKSARAFDDDDIVAVDHDTVTKHQGPLPKDKLLLKELSCVGGTAGCKLFTPNVVECENIGFNHDRSKYNWRCHAEMSERVTFNHVEVICEGYDYPEDDYILMGSCGLEFTLDYADPSDYHQNSYFHHMDEHEKELHRDRTEAKQGQQKKALGGFSSWIGQLGDILKNHLLLGIGTLVVVFMCLILVTRLYFSQGRQVDRVAGKRPASQRAGGASYGPLASAVLTTKKAC